MEVVLRGFFEGQVDAGFCIVASDAFEYDTDTEDGELVGQTCFDWSSPEINYPLDTESVKKFRERLLTGNDTFTSADVAL